MTLESIISQDLDNAELIVIDGGSDFETIEILNNYSSIITHLISENDKGIYDAMNKGIKLAKGKWLNFMNAGDRYFSKNTLKELSDDESFSDQDLVIGETLISYDDFERKMRVGNLQDIWKGAQFIHQSVLISRKYQIEHLYNVENKISADFEFFYHSIMSGAKIYKLDKSIAVFKSGGISDTKRLRAMLSNMKVVMSKDFSIFKFFYHGSKMFNELIKIIIKFFLPKKIISFFQKINLR
mgnify:CR=1 FL=1